MPTVRKRAAAWQDLVERYAYLAENAGQNVAERFLTNAESSFSDLSEQPLMGSPLTLRRPELFGMRKWQVKEFDDILIFICRDKTVYRLCACCMRRRTGGSCWELQIDCCRHFPDVQLSSPLQTVLSK